jgi:hypothetical protein
VLARWKRVGVLQSQTSLLPSKGAVRAKVVERKRTWIDGPFADAKRFTKEHAAILGDNEYDIREVAANSASRLARCGKTRP